jgi:peptidoglycan/xylan/chitin deacetylase (PgdA/CDA1 family)
VRLLSTLIIGAAIVGVAGVSAPAYVGDAGARVSPDVVFTRPTSERVVALTIDDGPSSATREILDVLAEFDAHATFFVIGDNVHRSPALAQAIVDQGSELGHHMMQDRPTIRLSATEFEARFREMDELLGGFPRTMLFRPGSGWYNSEMLEAVNHRSYRLVLGSIYPLDAQIPSVTAASWYILRWARPGAIIVLHDGPERGRRTAETLRRVLPELTRQGYRMTTVTDLLGREAADPASRSGPAVDGGPRS